MTVLIALYGSALLTALGLTLGLMVRQRATQVTLAGDGPASDRRWVGPYAIERKLGAGAMGEVYRARNGARGRDLALKLVPRGASLQTLRRFEQEARLGAQLRHPNAATIYGRGEAADGTPYITMELVEGETLQQLVQRTGPLSAGRVVRIARQLCAALGHLHQQGLVHRDIKPDNVIVTRRDRVKIIDFGLVERIGAALEPGAIVGTPLYISPEAIVAPGCVDARSDLYGLGALIYFMLCGAPVFGGQSALELCVHHLHTIPEPPSVALGSAIPAALERIVLDCLAKEAAARPPSAAALDERLAACGAPMPRPSPLAARVLGARRRAGRRLGTCRAAPELPDDAVRACRSRSRSARGALLA